MYGMSLLFKSNDLTVDYSPQGSKFQISELEHAVGGPFYLVTSSNEEKVFVVNQKDKTEVIGYNSHVNYLYRRLVNGEKVLRGDVLVCDRDLIDASVLSKYLVSETKTHKSTDLNFENNTSQSSNSNFEVNFS